MANFDNGEDFSVDTNTPKDYSNIKKGLWNPKKFIILSVLFSFLPALIMYSINYGRLGYTRKKKLYLIGGIVAFMVMILISILLGREIGKFLILSLNLGAGAYMQNDQINLYNEFISNGGKKASFVIAIVLCVVVTVLVIMVVVMSSSSNPEKKITIQGDEVYYTDSITKQEVDKLGAYLEKNKIFIEDDKTTSAKIDKKSNVYIFSIIINKQYLNDNDTLKFAKSLSKDLTIDVFNNDKVEIDLCDNRFNNLKAITY